MILARPEPSCLHISGFDALTEVWKMGGGFKVQWDQMTREGRKVASELLGGAWAPFWGSMLAHFVAEAVWVHFGSSLGAPVEFHVWCFLSLM